MKRADRSKRDKKKKIRVVGNDGESPPVVAPLAQDDGSANGATLAKQDARIPEKSDTSKKRRRSDVSEAELPGDKGKKLLQKEIKKRSAHEGQATIDDSNASADAAKNIETGQKTPDSTAKKLRKKTKKQKRLSLRSERNADASSTPAEPVVLEKEDVAADNVKKEVSVPQNDNADDKEGVVKDGPGERVAEATWKQNGKGGNSDFEVKVEKDNVTEGLDISMADVDEDAEKHVGPTQAKANSTPAKHDPSLGNDKDDCPQKTPDSTAKKLRKKTKKQKRLSLRSERNADASSTPAEPVVLEKEDVVAKSAKHEVSERKSEKAGDNEVVVKNVVGEAITNSTGDSAKKDKKKKKKNNRSKIPPNDGDGENGAKVDEGTIDEKKAAEQKIPVNGDDGANVDEGTDAIKKEVDQAITNGNEVSNDKEHTETVEFPAQRDTASSTGGIDVSMADVDEDAAKHVGGTQTDATSIPAKHGANGEEGCPQKTPDSAAKKIRKKMKKKKRMSLKEADNDSKPALAAAAPIVVEKEDVAADGTKQEISILKSEEADEGRGVVKDSAVEWDGEVTGKDTVDSGKKDKEKNKNRSMTTPNSGDSENRSKVSEGTDGPKKAVNHSNRKGDLVSNVEHGIEAVPMPAQPATAESIGHDWKKKESEKMAGSKEWQNRRLSAEGTGVPFKRVKETDVVFRHDELRDNSFFTKNDSYGARAHQDLVVTRGKGFRKEKTKKKRLSHHGGTLNYEVNSFKFPDDSE